MPVLIWTTWQPVARMRSASLIGLLVAFDDRKSQLVSQVGDRAFQQGRLARARGAHQVQGEDIAAGEPAPVPLRQAVVLGEHIRFQTNGRG